MDRSPLTKFPAEILNQIAELSLHHDEPLKIVQRHHSAFKFAGFKMVSKKDSKPIAYPAGFALTCKELYKNYLSLFYSTNNFTICTSPANIATSTKAFLDVVGQKHARNMGSLTIDVSLGPCRHPRGGSNEHLPPALRTLVSRLEARGSTPLFPDLGVDIHSALTSIILPLKYDDELIAMLSICKNVNVTTRFSVAGADPDKEVEMSFNWKSLLTSMEEVAVQLILHGKGHEISNLEQLFFMRLGHLIIFFCTKFDVDDEAAQLSEDEA